MPASALVATASLAALASLAAAAEYSVNWDAVPTNQPARVTTQTSEFGRCMCDLSDACDPNCCCDPDCEANTKNGAFTLCGREVSGVSELVMCAERTSGTEIRYTTQEVQYRDPVAGDAVCVVRTNLPDSAAYWELPAASGVAAASAPATPTWPARDGDTTTSSLHFKAGDRLPLIRATASGSSWNVGIQGNGYLVDPRPTGAGGRCERDRLTGFMEAHRYEECAFVGDLADLCENELNPAAFQYDAFTLPGFSLARTNSIIGIRHVVQDATGAVLTDVDPTSTFRQLFSRRQQPETAGLTTTRYNATQGVCPNAIRSRRLDVVYSSTATGASIVSATMTFVVGDVAANANHAYWSGFETVFTQEGRTVTENVPPRVGNPGYLLGAPVLAGRLLTNSDKSAVAARRSGLTVPFGRSCSTASHAGIRFGHDVAASSCSVNLTMAELNSVCSTGTDALLRAALTPPGGSVDSYLIDRLGFVANAQSTSINDWVTVEGMPWDDVGTGSFSGPLRQCSDITVGLRWVISVARAGPAFNPQDVIVGAKVERLVGAWRYRSTAPSTLFDFDFQVSFVRVEEGAGVRTKVISPPNILPEVEEDVWFPFRSDQQRVDDN